MKSLVKKIFTPQSLLSASILIAASSLTSRFLGLIRDRLLAGTFGAGDSLDMYYTAFRIPDLIFNLLILGALNSAFIPIFKDLLAKKKNDQAWSLANNLMSVVILVVLGIGIIICVFAIPFTTLVAPGFDDAKIETTAWLTRIMLFSPLFFGLSAISGGILSSFKRFVSYSFAPIFYNLGIIFGITILVPRYGLYGLAYGVVIGSFMHLLVQTPETISLGFRFRPIVDFSNKHLRQIASLMIPTTTSLAITQIMFTANNMIASTLAVGSIAIYNFANNIQSLPIGIFSIAICTAVFPNLVEHFSLKQHDSFANQVSKSTRQILYLIIPASLYLFLFRAQVVRLLLGTGAFGWDDTTYTLNTLGFFTISLPFQALIPLLVRSFYAAKNTSKPLIASASAMAVNVILALILPRYFGVSGLAFAFSIASIVNLIIIYILLHKQIPNFKLNIKIPVTKIIFASILSGAVAFICLRIFEPAFDNTTFLGLFGQTTSSSIIGIGIYLLASYVLKIEELNAIFKIFKLPFNKK